MTEHPIKRYRTARDMTLEGFAALAGTTPSTISRIENGQVNPSFEMLRRIVAATDGAVSADDLLAAGAEDGE